MRFTLIFIILATPVVFALPAGAKQNAAPTGTCPDLVAWSGSADVAASLPRHGGVPIGSGQVPPPLWHADFKVSPTTAGGTSPGIAGSPATPFSQEQVVNMVRDGFGDESGAKLIEQRGIDSVPSETPWTAAARRRLGITLRTKTESMAWPVLH